MIRKKTTKSHQVKSIAFYFSFDVTIDILWIAEPVREDSTAQTAASTTATATKSSYVPPHLRNAASSTVNTPSSAARPGPRRQKYAPDINSEVYFPSLSAAMGTDDPNRGQGQANR